MCLFTSTFMLMAVYGNNRVWDSNIWVRSFWKYSWNSFLVSHGYRGFNFCIQLYLSDECWIWFVLYYIVVMPLSLAHIFISIYQNCVRFQDYQITAWREKRRKEKWKEADFLRSHTVFLLELCLLFYIEICYFFLFSFPLATCALKSFFLVMQSVFQ